MKDCSIVEAYTTFKIKNIVEYTNAILRTVYGSNYNPSNETINQLKDCIKKHLVDFFNDNNFLELSRPDITDFFKEHKINNVDHQQVLYTMFNKIIDINMIKNDEASLNTCLILSDSILISIELDRLTNSIVSPNLSFKEAFDFIKSKYSETLTKDVSNIIRYLPNYLRDLVKKNIKTNEMMLKEYSNQDFNVEFLTISNEKDGEDLLEAKINISIENIQDKGKKKIEKIIGEEKLVIPLTNFIIDRIDYLILRLYLLKKNIPTFIIDVPEDYFRTKGSVKKILALLDNSILKDHIYLNIGERDYSKYVENLEVLNGNGIIMIIDDFDISNLNKREIVMFKYMNIDCKSKNMKTKIDLANELKIIPIMKNVNDDDTRKACIEKNIWFLQNGNDLKPISESNIME